jgi:hypothetical protein
VGGRRRLEVGGARCGEGMGQRRDREGRGRRGGDWIGMEGTVRGIGRSRKERGRRRLKGRVGKKIRVDWYLYGKEKFFIGLTIGPTKIGPCLGPALWAEVAAHALSTHRVVPALGTINRASCRDRAVLFRVVPRASYRAWPIWNSIVSVHERTACPLSATQCKWTSGRRTSLQLQVHTQVLKYPKSIYSTRQVE